MRRLRRGGSAICVILPDMLVLLLLAMDLKNATIVAPPTLGSPERKAAQMLSEEIEKRTRVRIPVADHAGAGPRILLGHDSGGKPDGYRIDTSANAITITGNDA